MLDDTEESAVDVEEQMTMISDKLQLHIQNQNGRQMRG